MTGVRYFPGYLHKSKYCTDGAKLEGEGKAVIRWFSSSKNNNSRNIITKN